jgi:CheY-like chemotaxis protein
MKTILIADDDIITRKVLKSMCEGLGYKVLECVNGKKAMETLKKHHVDILVTDWIMPEMSGVDLCEKLHEDPSRRSPFVFLITGKKKGLRNYADALAAGADDFLYKPVDYFVFRNQLRAAEEALSRPSADWQEGKRRAYAVTENSGH